ncbi:primosomal protein N' [Clostridiaceae bacterium UIB06]|uniref:Replication restart protein PriA n=1 Tax=Clostridium thailandense TaxID=2794346 RepID=A0A949TGS1_9CLOT|nr:primosomal protein N' [Clostridium thailandense]MBV7271935.1 primosomal protein N' [Clostridium thailandense]MCH5137161.1 primosomal protein N' [Clostridiaceae bacterium UIB06]
MYRYAGIIVNNTSVQLDKIFTYKIPENLMNKLYVGFRVKIPFGMGNKKIDGFVVELYEDINAKGNIKEIQSICEAFSVFTEKDLLLIKDMREKYLCTYLECIKVFIPTGIFKGIKNKSEALIYLGSKPNGKYDKEPYISIYKVVENNNGIYTKTALSKEFNLSLSSINTMLKNEFLAVQKQIVNRYNEKQYEVYSPKVLNEKQQKAVERILKSKDKVFLLHGVTGSGKTEIYMHLVSEMIEQNKESIILVPEIALTPQMVERFKGRFGKDISVFHSKLSEGERYDEWLRVKMGKVKVAIGARSAIFLPFENLGLIVIDEEHEGSYKSDSNPKYNAREIGEFKCNMGDCKLVLGSATPSIESYYKCEKSKIDLITIKNRADNAIMPEIQIVDMREELLSNNKSIFSRDLYNFIGDRLNKKEQIILFLNRRGYSTFVSCRKCGYVFKCNNCDISLTYHHEGKRLVCHYCGSKQFIPNTCPKCGSKYVKYFGVGTEKIEQEINKVFPSAKTLRMDFDTTRSKNSYENIYKDFKAGKADILIGTQMVAKGLDFKNVTLVGVIAADLSLNLPDFRSTERTFQLITQVSGRAGRGEKAGKVIVQTYNPDNYSIRYACDNDYSNFYKEEINIRYTMDYPPFSEILLINMSSKNENILIKSIQNVGIYLKNKIEKDDKIKMLGPCPCQISKIKELYRWQIILKGKITREFGESVRKIVYDLLKDVYNDIRVSIDMNPNSLL